MMDLAATRDWMVERQIADRGVRDENVLRAMREVPRDVFVPPEYARHAYADRPLPIGEGQTISQPYVVALMAEAAEIGPGDRVLEVGTGSGYAAAVFSRIAEHVYTVERHAALATDAAGRFEALGYDNISVAVRDGSLGWPDHSPYDAIIVAAGAPADVPGALQEQLAPGGRLIIPLGATRAGQELVRVRRSADGRSLIEEDLGAVAFVPLIGEAAWHDTSAVPGNGRNGDERVSPVSSRSGSGTSIPRAARTERAAPGGLAGRIARSAEAFDDVDSADLTAVLDRIGDARLVLLGEASHGTSEFYRMRARITRALLERRGFDFVAVEADWPDAAEIDAWVRHSPAERPHRKPFQRFPTWMWANAEVMEFVHWMRDFNRSFRSGDERAMAGFHGMDLYSMHASIDAILAYLDDVDPSAATVARQRYECLMPWRNDPVLYGRTTLGGSLDECEKDVVAMLNELLRRRLEYVRRDGARFFDAVQNARLVTNAERYYRTMYQGSVSSWNLRDQHMFDTLVALLGLYGPASRGVVWAHNSHIGDATATAMGARGEHNVGQLARRAFDGSAYLVGFGTHTGTVAAAADWGGPVEIMRVRPSHPRSYERLVHETGIEAFLLHLREPADASLRHGLAEERLERAIGVIYRPETELQSHYFSASLPHQFDEWIWFDTTEAVTPLGEQHRRELADLPETFPFGL